MKIDYLGKSLKSKHFDGTIIKEEVEDIRNTYYTEDKEVALNQLEKVLSCKYSSTNYIHRYYFERIANNGKKHNSKWTINEMLASDELVQLFINKTKANTKLFLPEEQGIRNFRKALALGGSNNFGVLTTFPVKQCIAQIKEHIPEGGTTYVDPCCGWGSRMIASACLDLEYIGFETNALLIPKLKELGVDIKRFKPEFKYTIYEQGNQETVTDLYEKADIIFTSPPYYNLEIYSNNDFEKINSVDVSYEEWLDSFVKPMFDNLIKYSKKETKTLMNIKDFKEYTLVDDFIRIGKESGYVFEGFYDLKTIKRTNMFGELVASDEPILSFRKVA